MRIVDIMSEELVLPEIRATSKDEVLAEVVGCLCGVRKEIDAQAALRVLIDREKLGSTGVGNGFAIPHGKLPRLTGLVACFARSSAGVEFGSLDGRPAHLFLTLLAPEGSAGLHLKALARASKLFKDPAFRAQLMAVADRRTLWNIIAAQDARLSKSDELRD
jgi:PTS system nitrogen regulatory IIA component